MLAKTLRRNVADPSVRWPQTRSQLIRSLSVFVTYLDSAAPLLETNRAVCERARETISKILDEIIDGPRLLPGDAESSSTLEQTLPPDIDVLDDAEASGRQPTFADAQPSLSFLEGDALTHELFGQDFDLDQWLENTDGMLTGDWNLSI